MKETEAKEWGENGEHGLREREGKKESKRDVGEYRYWQEKREGEERTSKGIDLGRRDSCIGIDKNRGKKGGKKLQNEKKLDFSPNSDSHYVAAFDFVFRHDFSSVLIIHLWVYCVHVLFLIFCLSFLPLPPHLTSFFPPTLFLFLLKNVFPRLLIPPPQKKKILLLYPISRSTSHLLSASFFPPPFCPLSWVIAVLLASPSRITSAHI